MAHACSSGSEEAETGESGFKVSDMVRLRPAWVTCYPILEQTKKQYPHLGKKTTIYTESTLHQMKL